MLIHVRCTCTYMNVHYVCTTVIECVFVLTDDLRRSIAMSATSKDAKSQLEKVSLCPWTQVFAGMQWHYIVHQCSCTCTGVLRLAWCCIMLHTRAVQAYNMSKSTHTYYVCMTMLAVGTPTTTVVYVFPLVLDKAWMGTMAGAELDEVTRARID